MSRYSFCRIHPDQITFTLTAQEAESIKRLLDDTQYMEDGNDYNRMYISNVHNSLINALYEVENSNSALSETEAREGRIAARSFIQENVLSRDHSFDLPDFAQDPPEWEFFRDE